MVDFSKRWPVLAETTPQVRGAPEMEQARADIYSIIKWSSRIHLCRNYKMSKMEEFEMADFNAADRMIDFSSISPALQQTVKRLLDEESQSGYTEEKGPGYYCWFYIDPLSPFALFWNLLYMVFFYLIELEISLALAFGSSFLDQELDLAGTHRTFYILALVFLAIDIMLSFFRGYYSQGRGRVVDDWKQITHKYLCYQFPFDVVIWVVYIIPFFHIAFGLNFLQLVSAGLLWIKKFRYQAQVITYLQYSPNARVIFMLVVLFSDVLLIGNYGACVFIGIDVLLYNANYYGSNTAYYWLTNNTSYPLSLINGPWYFQYIYAQQFSTGTLSTLAPGPFAKNPIEVTYAVVVMILFMVLASYVGEVLIQIMYTHSERRIFHQENILSFDNFMQLKEVERGIRKRIYNFFELVWEVELKVESKEQEALIDKLPAYLKEELLLQMGFSRSIYFLQYLPQQSTLEKLISMKLQRVTIDAITCIFQSQRTSYLARNIYYIKQGMAKFYLDSPLGEKVINLTNVQRMLGVYQFITGQNYQVSCKSIDLCLIQKLSFHNFMAIVDQLNIWEEFKELQHKVLLERNMKVINKLCVLCLESHTEGDCPELHVGKRVKEDTIHDCFFERENKRVAYKRRKLGQERLIGVSRNNVVKTSVFSLYQNINLGKMILDINKLESLEDPIDEVKIYRTYFKPHNIA